MRKLIIALAVLASASAFAGPHSRSSSSSSSSNLTSPGAYGVAGCGLGSLAFHDQRGPIQIVAATVNGTSGSQTFGITTGTSNCNDGHNLIKAFIHSNYENLKVASARGEGESLTGLAAQYKCSNAEGFSKAVKSNYQDLFKSNDPDTTQMGLDYMIKNSDLKNSCQV